MLQVEGAPASSPASCSKRSALSVLPLFPPTASGVQVLLSVGLLKALGEISSGAV